MLEIKKMYFALSIILFLISVFFIVVTSLFQFVWLGLNEVTTTFSLPEWQLYFFTGSTLSLTFSSLILIISK